MRRLLTFVGTVLVLGAAACSDEVLYPDDTPAAPSGLYYQLEPSGDPISPRGVTLRWDWSDDPNIAVWHVYSRGAGGEPFGLRGSTTSPSFHDDGVPHLEYYVTAESQYGFESAPSASVVIDERLRLPAPLTLTSVSLNGRIHLEWSDNAYQADPAGFSHYRVYSTLYDLDQNVCGTDWVLEGTTVSATFLVGNLSNGVPRCFGVSAITIEGFESLWSPLRYDTPRPDGRAVAVFLPAANALQSGFRFFLDGNNDGLASPLELGLVGNAASGTLDFVLQTGGAGQLQIVPQRAVSTFRQYGAGPLADLTDIDIAPFGGYGRTPLDATVRYGYVFEIAETDGFYRYGAIRVIAVGTNYVVFDWSYQTDRGNPELLRSK